MTNDDDLLTAAGVAAMAVEGNDPITPATVRRDADRGVLPFLPTPSGMRLFRRADAKHYLQDRREHKRAKGGRRG